MKITKFQHSCLLIEMPEPVNRTVLFDPGVMSEHVLDVDSLVYLDDIVITHQHSDHFSVPLLQKLVARFPDVRILAPPDTVELIREAGITNVTSEPPEGITLFDAPHESVEPVYPQPDNLGVHYLDTVTHPGDSHSFNETKKVLALPLSGPWASTIRAINLALELKPAYVLPIHDWHWSEVAREGMYQTIEGALAKQGITFVPLATATPVVLDV